MTPRSLRIIAGCIVAVLIILIVVLFSGCSAVEDGVYVKSRYGDLTYTLPRPSRK